MKKKISLLLTILAITMLPTTALASNYVGNLNSGKFHYTSCRWAHKMRASNRVPFEDRNDAIAEGYVPCKVCRP